MARRERTLEWCEPRANWPARDGRFGSLLSPTEESLDREFANEHHREMVDVREDASRCGSSISGCIAAQLLIGVLLVGAASGCEDADDDLDFADDDEYRLTAIGPNVLVTNGPTSFWGNETSAVGWPQGSTVKLFASYNSWDGLPHLDGTQTHCGWAISGQGTAFWAYDDYATPLPGYGTGSDGSAYHHCLGDTWSADVSHSATSPMVAMVAVARNTGASVGCGSAPASGDVAMWTSTNGGLSFSNVKRLSDAGSGGCADGPKVAWDPTNHKAWVTWSNRGTPYMRSVAINAAGAMTLGPTINLSSKLQYPGAVHISIAIKKAAPGQQPTIWLAYANRFGTKESCLWEHTTLSVTWWLSRSTDGGATFSQHQTVGQDPAWPRCLSASPKGNNRALISAAYDPSNGGRVILAYSRHIDDAAGNFVGTRIVKAQTPRANGAQGFDRWITLCNPAVCPVPPQTGMGCEIPGEIPPVGETVCHQFGAAVGVKSAGTRRVAFVWHDTKDSDDAGFPHRPPGDTTVVELKSDVWGAAFRSGGPTQDCAPPAVCSTTRITPLSPDVVPWLGNAANGNLWWGDYEGGVVPFDTGFYAIWGDNRDGTSTSKLYGAKFNE